MIAMFGTGSLCVVAALGGDPLAIAAAGTYWLGCIGVTIAGNVPLNDALDRDAGLWPTYRTRWTALNSLRGVATLAAAGLLIAAYGSRPSRARAIAQSWFARKTGRSTGRQRAQELAVGEHRPVEADVGDAAPSRSASRRRGRQVARRPRPPARAAARTGVISERRVQVVREPPLEVLARDGADLRRAVGLDRDVDRLPPQRVGAPVGERVEHRLRGARTSHSSTNAYSARGDRERSRGRAPSGRRTGGRAAWPRRPKSSTIRAAAAGFSQPRG